MIDYIVATEGPAAWVRRLIGLLVLLFSMYWFYRASMKYD